MTKDTCSYCKHFGKDHSCNEKARRYNDWSDQDPNQLACEFFDIGEYDD